MKHLNKFNEGVTSDNKVDIDLTNEKFSPSGLRSQVRMGKFLKDKEDSEFRMEATDDEDKLEGILRSLISSNPNDTELGKEVRRLFKQL